MNPTQPLVLAVRVLLAMAPSAAWAQTPEAFRYQAVARDGGGQLVVNTAVGVQFQVHSGSAGGPVVYAETHNPTTNTQGLFTVAVGEGTPSTGTFSSIAWAAATYWVEVGLDPAGGTAYGTIGVQQLLSVPYALEAKSAAHASSATLADTATTAVHADTASYALNAGPAGTAVGEMRYWNGTDWVAVAPPSNEGATLKFQGGAPYWDGGMAIGDTLQGGIIAYFFQPGDPGYVVGEIHGLIAAPSDLGITHPWGCANMLIPGADGTALGTGEQNTADMLSAGCSGAAPACSNLVLNGYDDWFLPSKVELEKVYLARDLIGGFLTDLGDEYLTSSEHNAGHAYVTGFWPGASSSQAPKGSSYPVRAVRYF